MHETIAISTAHCEHLTRLRDADTKHDNSIKSIIALKNVTQEAITVLIDTADIIYEGEYAISQRLFDLELYRISLGYGDYPPNEIVQWETEGF